MDYSLPDSSVRGIIPGRILEWIAISSSRGSSRPRVEPKPPVASALPGRFWWLSGKQSACQCRSHKRLGFNPWVRKIPWSRKWQLTLVFLPEESQGQRSLVSYSLWGHKESDMTEHKTYRWNQKEQLKANHFIDMVKKRVSIILY